MSERIGVIRQTKGKLADAIEEVKANAVNAEDMAIYALPFTAPEMIYVPPTMGAYKNRGKSNRKEKTVSKNKRKMIKRSKKNNRKH